jgi:shikimate kinase
VLERDRLAAALPPLGGGVGAHRNVVLIGMPGVGKSTVGVLLAKATGRDFVDTDVWIQAREGAGLPELLARHGRAGFLALEERHVLALDAENAVIATGGSVVYGERAMAHLRARGTLVHLALPLEALAARLGSLAARGVVIDPGQDLAVLYADRMPLYRRFAERTVEAAGLGHEAVLVRLLEALAALGA